MATAEQFFDDASSEELLDVAPRWAQLRRLAAVVVGVTAFISFAAGTVAGLATVDAQLEARWQAQRAAKEPVLSDVEQARLIALQSRYPQKGHKPTVLHKLVDAKALRDVKNEDGTTRTDSIADPVLIRLPDGALMVIAYKPSAPNSVEVWRWGEDDLTFCAGQIPEHVEYTILGHDNVDGGFRDQTAGQLHLDDTDLASCPYAVDTRYLLNIPTSKVS